ncbi:MAG: ISL3 family transposase [Thermoanaerobaculia bacterium]|nr:ISL3 family transposase [Thermoanaerobaculia bacterium]
MRATTVLNKLLRLPGLWVRGLRFEHEMLIVGIKSRSRKPTCPRCGWRARGRFEIKTRQWRHVAIGGIRTVLEGPIRRLRCQRVVTEQVPWARHGSRFTRSFEGITAYLAQNLPKTKVVQLLGIAWETVGSIAGRMVQEQLSERRFDGLRRIGVDEISYRRHHKHLTVVVNHDTGHVVWVAEGKSSEVLRSFFEELGSERLAQIQVVSLDLSAAYQKAIREAVPGAEMVFDKFHIAQLAQRALDEVRREIQRNLSNDARKPLKKPRWALLKNPDRLTDKETEKLAGIQQHNEPLYRGLPAQREPTRQSGNPHAKHAEWELRSWLQWACRCRLKPFVRLSRTVRKHLDGILRASITGLTNARLEAMNSNIRILNHRARGFHHPQNLIAMVYLCCSRIQVATPRLG